MKKLGFLLSSCLINYGLFDGWLLMIIISITSISGASLCHPGYKDKTDQYLIQKSWVYQSHKLQRKDNDTRQGN